MTVDLVVTCLARSAKTRSWLDVRRYDLVGLEDLRAVISSLAEHRSFHDAYLAGHPTFAEGQHGPYLVRTIGAVAYQETNVAAARRTLVEAADDSSAFLREIDTELARPREKAKWFVLDPEGLATHDAAWALTAFAEVVAVDVVSGTLDVIVCGAD